MNYVGLTVNNHAVSIKNWACKSYNFLVCLHLSMRLRFLLSSLWLSLLFYSCDRERENLVAKGNKSYGGEISFVAPPINESWFPLNAHSVNEQRLLSAIFEPFLRVDASGKIHSNIVKKVLISQNGKKITLKIRKGVYFHPDACFGNEYTEATIDDYAFSLAIACSGLKINQLGHVLTGKIEGSELFSKRTKAKWNEKLPSGIKIISDNTLEIKLTDAYPDFLLLLSHPSIVLLSKEAFTKYGNKITQHPVGTGPYYLASSTKQKTELYENEKYWKKDKFGNQLPFIKTITIRHKLNHDKEYNLFSNGQIDWFAQLGVDQLENSWGSLKEIQRNKKVLHQAISQKGSLVHFVGMNCETAPFFDLRVRRAFLLTINRNELFNRVLNGDGNIDAPGFIPLNFGYKGASVKTIEFNPDEARRLMSECGYYRGVGFPEIDFYYTAENKSLTDYYCRYLKNTWERELGVKIKLRNVNYLERKKAILTGKAELFKSGWTADYPSSEAYLGVFYSGNKGRNNENWNLINFKDFYFDRLYRQLLLEKDKLKKQYLLEKCDQLLLDEAAVIPLFTEDYFLLVNIRIRGFKINESGIIDFSNLYIKETK